MCSPPSKMPRRKKKEYYAVVRGRCYPAPAIFTSWYAITSCNHNACYNAKPCRAEAHALVDGCKGNVHKGFYTFEEAVAYMEEQGVNNYAVFNKKLANETNPFKGEKFYYAVANGRAEGIYEQYL